MSEGNLVILLALVTFSLAIAWALYSRRKAVKKLPDDHRLKK